jgi:hypothetical protein
MKAPDSDAAQGSLSTLFTGHAYRFASELHAVFPDATRADWSELLRWALALPESSVFLFDEKQRILSTLYAIFVQTCSELAHLLIDESFMPDGQRTMKPDALLSTRGCKKFRHHARGTVVFEVVEDLQLSSGEWMYGGHIRNDRLAMKRAGHELKAARALSETGPSLLNCPMMATFSHRNKRILCLSVLPANAALVQGEDSTLGRFLKPNQQVERVMHSVAANLLLAKSRKPGEEVYGPSDMEIYETDDGVFYMTKAARLLPPEYRKGGKPALRYALLRPELMRKAGKPLIPDAMCYADEVAQRALLDVSHTLDEEIAALARELGQGQNADRISSRDAVKALMHSRGLNMRHLCEVIALLSMGGAARVQLQSVLDWRRPNDQMHVKTLSYSRQASEQELRNMLKLQQQLLEAGGNRMQMVSTLLRLSDVVGESVPLEKQRMEGYSKTFRPGGKHPLVEAWNICEQCDGLDVQYRGGQRLTWCSKQTQIVMYEILRCMTDLQVASWDSLSR